MDEILVAVDARFLRYPLIAGLNLDGVVVVLEREGDRMEEAIVALRDPFPNKVMGQVAVVAGRNVMVAALLPRIEVVLHYVAVCTRSGIIAEVAGALPVAKGEGANACEYSQQGNEDQTQIRRAREA